MPRLLKINTFAQWAHLAIADFDIACDGAIYLTSNWSSYLSTCNFTCIKWCKETVFRFVPFMWVALWGKCYALFFSSFYQKYNLINANHCCARILSCLWTIKVYVRLLFCFGFVLFLFSNTTFYQNLPLLCSIIFVTKICHVKVN